MWKLVYIDREGDIQSFTPGTIEECFANLPRICQGDEDIEASVRADLSRVGARYAEFVGGTIVLASLD